MLEKFFHKIWYGKKSLFWCLLWPLSVIYGFVIYLRKCFYRIGIFKSYQAPCKVIIVGNQTIGGGGKTPMVIALVRFFQKQGKQVGVICKGYKGSLTHSPQWVDLCLHSPFDVGDEAILLKKNVSCAVVAAKNRAEGAKYLFEKTGCDIIISDDGLTHLALGRDLEIILENKEVGLGNASLLPAGPLREKLRSNSKSRLFVESITLGRMPNTFDRDSSSKACLDTLPSALINEADDHNRYEIYRYPFSIYHLKTHRPISLLRLKEHKLTAIAAIAHPENFFQTLRVLGLSCSEKAYADHYLFKQSDFSHDTAYIMTEKDAVKCANIDCKNIYVLALCGCLSVHLKKELAQRFF